MSHDLHLLALTSEQFLGLYNYWIVIFLMMTGFFIVIARKNMVKTVIGLNIFQTSVFLLYITMGKVDGGTAPIIPADAVDEHSDHSHGHSENTDHAEHAAEVAVEHAEHAAEAGQHVSAFADPATGEILYSNPLPSVLMLTAIVVGIATTALALALIVRIREDYGTIEEDEILLLDRES